MNEPKQYEMSPQEVEALKNSPLPAETAPMAADRADSTDVDPRSPASRAAAARRSRMRSGRG
jgi:hypothetical protein